MTEKRKDPFHLPEITSPEWQTGTRLVVAGMLVIFLALLAFATRGILALFVLALLLAYILQPIVGWLERRIRARRGLAVAIVYILLVIVLIGTTTGIGLVIRQQVINIVADLVKLLDNLPALLSQLASIHVQLGPWDFDLGQVNLDPLIESLTSSIQPLVGQTGTLLATALTTTATTVGLFIIVLVMGYYLLRDFDQLAGAFLSLVPGEYELDFTKLLDETGKVWSSFLRGQLSLALVMGAGSAALYAAIGVRSALGLGLITGLMEFIPIFGPYIAGLVAVLLALFQTGNVWGLSPVAFTLLVLALAVLIQQIENIVLVPRIIGHSLRLHPLIVLVATIAGGVLAGFLGILLAAPTVATFRLWGGYVYSKTVGLDTWPSPVIEDAASQPNVFQRVRSLMPVRRLETVSEADAESDEAPPAGEPPIS